MLWPQTRGSKLRSGRGAYRGFLLGTGAGQPFPPLLVLVPRFARSIIRRTSGGLRSLPIAARIGRTCCSRRRRIGLEATARPHGGDGSASVGHVAHGGDGSASTARPHG